MATAYPTAIDTVPNAPPGNVPLGASAPKHTEVHQKIADLLNALQSTLGINPQGDAVSVAQRIANLESIIDGGPILISAPACAIAPAVTGLTTLSATLACSTGTWSGTPSAYAYQWQRNGSGITGETASTYAIAAADDGTTLRCVVTATNDFGSTDANSNGVPISFAPAYTPSLDFSNGLNSGYIAALAA
jgi:hypothetical protein